jgi:hypothetical protein
MPAKLKVQHVAHTDVDDAEKPLIPPLELALIEYLDCNDRGIIWDGAGRLR